MKSTTMDLTSPAPPIQSDDGWQAMLERILAAMNCRTGTIHRYDSDSQLLSLVTQVGIPAELMPKVQSIPLGKGIAGAAAERREAVQLCNLQTDDTGVARPDAKKTQVAGSLAIPVLNDADALVGTLGVGMFVPHDFSEAETETLWEISRWLAPSFS